MPCPGHVVQGGAWGHVSASSGVPLQSLSARQPAICLFGPLPAPDSRPAPIASRRGAADDPLRAQSRLGDTPRGTPLTTRPFLQVKRCLQAAPVGQTLQPPQVASSSSRHQTAAAAGIRQQQRQASDSSSGSNRQQQTSDSKQQRASRDDPYWPWLPSL